MAVAIQFEDASGAGPVLLSELEPVAEAVASVRPIFAETLKAKLDADSIDVFLHRRLILKVDRVHAEGFSFECFFLCNESCPLHHSITKIGFIMIQTNKNRVGPAATNEVK